MKTFSLTLFDGHPIIEDNGNTILLDTGESVPAAYDFIHLSPRPPLLKERGRSKTPPFVKGGRGVVLNPMRMNKHRNIFA